MPQPDNNQTTTLKIIGTESANILSSLWQRTFQEAYFDIHSQEDIEQYCHDNYSPAAALELLDDPAVLCKLAYRQQTPIGLYILKQQDCPLVSECDAIELKQLYLLSSEYGRGLANVMFHDLLKTARMQNIGTIWLSVSDKNRRAQAYYSKLGFQRLGKGPTFQVGNDRLISSILSLSTNT